MRSSFTTIAWSGPPTDRAWWRRPLASIRGLDAGSWFERSFRGEPVPTFEETLALCAELGLGINVEIKPCPGRERETAAATMKALLELWPRSMPAPLISSFAPACLRVAQEMAPEMPRGYLAGTLPRHWRELMAQHGCTTLHLNHRRIVPWQRATVLAAGVPLVLYTVNDGLRARRYIEAGVAAVITDRIDRVLSFWTRTRTGPDRRIRAAALAPGWRPLCPSRHEAAARTLNSGASGRPADPEP